ncbi:hypothetical protein [Couchioplanes azureus]|uniref:hypothetical protein n=1 Tax=Couchioplanes caeruleus TaxID=56438 RepID=UPI001670A038|nr:hypothetical protein [Couchioplanes caeruleus]GGQ45899.1 hypothetical protein GCM10010166_13140 [Couchioplanes caeruleus subsp. azureus]
MRRRISSAEWHASATASRTNAGQVVDETIDKVKIHWTLGGYDWLHKRDIYFMG